MSPPDIIALRQYLGPELKGRTISDAQHVVSLTDIIQHSCLTGRSCALSGRSVLLATSGQLLSALAMIELDGVARRLFLWPPDLDWDRLEVLLAQTDIDTIVTDQSFHRSNAGKYIVIGVDLPERRAMGSRGRSRDRVADADLGDIRAAEDCPTYARWACWRDHRRGACAQPERNLGDVLRHPPLRRPANFPARRDRRRIDRAFGARGSSSLPMWRGCARAVSPTSPGRRRTGASS